MFFVFMKKHNNNTKKHRFFCVTKNVYFLREFFFSIQRLLGSFVIPGNSGGGSGPPGQLASRLKSTNSVSAHGENMKMAPLKRLTTMQMSILPLNMAHGSKMFPCILFIETFSVFLAGKLAHHIRNHHTRKGWCQPKIFLTSSKPWGFLPLKA